MKQVPVKDWTRFLKSLGLKLIRTTKGSHEVWDKKDGSLSRPIIFRVTKKEIPIDHIKTNLFTLGISLKEFKERISGQRKKKSKSKD